MFSAGDPSSQILFPEYGIDLPKRVKLDKFSEPALHTYAAGFKVASMLGATSTLAHKEAMKQVKKCYKLVGGIWT